MVDTITLSIPAVDVLAEQLELAVRQYPFDVPRGGEEERARARPRVWEELERGGFARQGRTEPEVEDALYLLSGAEITVAAAGLLDASRGQRLAARVVATGEVGLVGVLGPRGLRMTFIDPERVPWACVELLPDAPAGPGERARAVADRSRGVPADEDIEGLGPLSALTAAPKTRLGHFLVTSGDDRGQRRRAGNVIWFDTARGRYALRGERGQADVVEAEPADRHRLAEHLAGLVQHTDSGVALG
ncbi:hypothetical protein GCM10027174_05630 [Salinifilum aidingensis]